MAYFTDQGKHEPMLKTKYLIVIDGIRYKLFELQGKEWKYTAYMNLLSLKERHPYFEQVSGAYDFFKRVMPE